MRAGTTYLLVVAWLGAAAFTAGVRGQQPPLPAAPQPIVPPVGPITPPTSQPVAPPVLGQPVPPPVLGQPAPAPGTVPPVGPTTLPPVPVLPPVVPVVPAPAPFADPGRDGWATVGAPSRPPGLFLNTELDVVWPTVKNRLSGTVMFASGATETLHVPQADLSTTVEPGFELGYRLPDSLGDLLFGYRFLVTDGHRNLEASFGEASVRSRLDINQFDIDYATATYSPLPRYDLKFRIGARMATVFLDSQASDAFHFQQASNYFIGAGPSATIDFERRFKELPELGLFARGDFAALEGQVRQKFRDNIDVGTPGEQDAFFEAQKTQVSEVLTVQAGFIYHPFGVTNDRLRITGGYQFQRWWGVGKINGGTAPNGVSSDAEVTTQGVFLRGEFDF